MRHTLHIDTFMAAFFFFSSNQRFDLWRIFPIVPFFVFLFFFVHFFPSVMIALFFSCFVLLFRSLDFYGDCKLPRNNESLGIKKREQ